MVLNDKEILALCDHENGGMITPFETTSVKEVSHIGSRLLSYGVSSFGYDVRLGDEVKIFTNQNAGVIDPKRLDEGTLIDATIKFDPDGSKYVILPPNSYLLGVTMEYFHIPRDVMIIAVGKSTLARAGCICNTTPIEPGFEGNVVIELSNATSLPMRVYLNEGIAQFIFFKGNPCRTSYADRNGKYQGQTGVTLPRV